MPCSGPDIPEVRKQAISTALALLDRLIIENNLMSPIPNMPFMTQKTIDDWENAKNAFVDAVIELFVQDALNSF